MTKKVDLTGKRFGKLTVLHQADNHISKNGNSRIVWHCRCECGNETIVGGAPLLDGRTQSCGCWKQSRLEVNVIKYFQSMGYENSVDYECQKKFENLTGVGDRLLSYDFLVYKNGKEVKCLIECQGLQHYRAVEHFGGEKQFQRQQEHDKLKKDYARMLGVELIEIPYTMKKYDDIKQFLEKCGV